METFAFSSALKTKEVEMVVVVYVLLKLPHWGVGFNQLVVGWVLGRVSQASSPTTLWSLEMCVVDGSI